MSQVLINPYRFGDVTPPPFLVAGVYHGNSGWSDAWLVQPSMVIPSSTESDQSLPMASNCVLSLMTITLRDNTRDGTTFMNLRVEGADGNQSVSITSSTTGSFQDITNSDTITAQDKISYQHDAVATTGNISCNSASMQSDVPFLKGGYGGNTIRSSTTYVPLGNVFSSIESGVGCAIPFNATFKRMIINVKTNTRDGSIDYTFRVDGADGNQGFNIPSTSTGLFQDVTNSDIVSAESEINFRMGMNGTTGGLLVLGYSMEYT